MDDTLVFLFTFCPDSQLETEALRNSASNVANAGSYKPGYLLELIFSHGKHQHGKIFPYRLCLIESPVSSSGTVFPKHQSTNTGIKMEAAQRGQCVGAILLPPDFENVYVRMHHSSFIISTINMFPGKQT